MKRITVDLPKGLWERIRERAEEDELTAGEVIRNSLRDTFADEEDGEGEESIEEEDVDEAEVDENDDVENDDDDEE
jgi:Arc/MetJ-type ribon-helix-helix transcriptional regulator